MSTNQTPFIYRVVCLYFVVKMKKERISKCQYVKHNQELSLNFSELFTSFIMIITLEQVKQL